MCVFNTHKYCQTDFHEYRVYYSNQTLHITLMDFFNAEIEYISYLVAILAFHIATS